MPKASSSSVQIFYPRYSRAEILHRIRSNVGFLREKLPLKLVALFGSYAAMKHTVASDIDVLIVYEGNRREDAYALCKKILAIQGLEPHVYSEGEHEKLKGSIKRMLKDSIVLYPVIAP
jgi:predicted nucleotidyltransferase